MHSLNTWHRSWLLKYDTCLLTDTANIAHGHGWHNNYKILQKTELECEN